MRVAVPEPETPKRMRMGSESVGRGWRGVGSEFRPRGIPGKNFLHGEGAAGYRSAFLMAGRQVESSCLTRSPKGVRPLDSSVKEGVRSRMVPESGNPGWKRWRAVTPEPAERGWIWAVTRLRSRPVAKALLIRDNVLKVLTTDQGPERRPG